MAKILLVDDDIHLTDALKEWLTDEDYVVDIVSDGDQAEDFLGRYPYDLAVLDWNLPGKSGVQICQAYRSKGGTMPIIMLTGRAGIDEKEKGLDAGADDYMTKPFHPRELSARVRALLRRPRPITQNVIEVGNVTLDMTAHTVSRNGKQINLVKKEFALLELFMRNPDTVFSVETILDRLWASENEATPETVRVHIKRLRAKIETDENQPLIRTIHRVGYKLESSACN